MKRGMFVLLVMVLLLVAVLPATAGERATINAGTLKTEVWQNGLMGDTTSGLNYRGAELLGSSLIRLGSLWFGGSVDGKKTFGVSSGQYNASGTAESEWAGDSLGVQVSVPGILAPQEISLNLSDADASLNRGIRLGVEAKMKTHQWSYAPADKFYILEYSFRNQSAVNIDSAYAGLWHTASVLRNQAINTENIDYAGYDTTVDPVNSVVRNLAYVSADSVQCQTYFGINPSFIGIRLLQANKPDGSTQNLDGACGWRGTTLAPQSDASPLDYRNRYHYISRGRFDLEQIPMTNIPKRTLDSLHLKIDSKVLGEVIGVWDVTDTSHLGTNYYLGGSFVANSGIITLGTPKADRLKNVAKEEDYQTDTLTVQVQNLPLAQVSGVYDNAAGTGTNYYTGGSFVSSTGVITLGTPYVKLNTVNNEEDWAGDEYTVYAQITPLYQVISVYDNPAGTGTDYFAGGTYSESGQITLGTPYPNYGSAPLYVNYRWRETSPAMYVDYSYKQNNVVVSYNYYYNKTGVVPNSSMDLTLPDYTGLESVAGVYRQSDTLMAGINYYTGGSFDKSNGQVLLGSPLPDDTADYYLRENYTYDEYFTLTDSCIWLGMGIWPDYNKVVEILGVYDNPAGTGTNYYTGGSYDPVTYNIYLGTKYTDGIYGLPVYITYRYLKLTNALVVHHNNDLGPQNVVLSVGPWNMSPGDSARAVFAVVAGNTLAELQAASDTALYLWNNPGASLTTTKGSVSGRVLRTLNRGPVENAVVTIYQSGAAVDSGRTDAEGRYFISNLETGIYDSLVATAAGYLQDRIVFNATVPAGRDTTGLDLILVSSRAQLSGRVFRSDSTTAAAGVMVFLIGANKDSCLTDCSGCFNFEKVLTTSGDSLVFKAAEFTTDTVSGLVLMGDSTVVFNKVLHSVNGWLDGVVTKLDSVTPVAGAVINLSGPTAAMDTTDAQGRYSIPNLPAGSYNVSISATGYSTENVSSLAIQSDSTTKLQTRLSQVFYTPLTWKAKTNLPAWRYGAASCQVAGKLYLFGGRDYALARNEAYCYDPSADTLGGSPWTTLSPMPTARYGLGCAAVGDSIIYVVGGYSQDSTALSVLEAYIIGSNMWVTGLPFMPTPRAFMGVTSIKDSVYAVGGENSQFVGLDTVEIYLASSNSWVTKKALLGGPAFGRSGPALVALDSLGVKRVYSVGGKKVDESYMTVNHKYNPLTNAWVSRASLSNGFGYGAGAAVNDSLYVAGGRYGSNSYSYTANVYSPFTNTWSANTAMPVAAAYMACSSQDSVGFWVLGGKLGDSYISDSLYHVYKPGAVQGTVQNKSATPLEGVMVQAKQGPTAKNSEVTKTDGSFLMAGLEPGFYDISLYRAGVIDTVLVGVKVNWGRVTDLGIVTGVKGEKPEIIGAARLSLNQSWPNPVQGQASITFQLPARAEIELALYNILGQKVKVLASGNHEAGIHTVNWNGRDEQGRKVASGVYVYRLTCGSNRLVRKLVVIR